MSLHNPYRQRRFAPTRAHYVILTLMVIGITSPTAWAENRAIDGMHNNLANPTWGGANMPLVRDMPCAYDDGISSPAGPQRPSPRAISNAICAQTTAEPNPHGLTDFVWQWGQFIDHDIDLTGTSTPLESFDIDVPTGDPWFDPFATGAGTIVVNRSAWDRTTGTGPDNPRQQINQITAWIDASNVYGSDVVRAAELRTFVGGRLQTSAGDLLPFNTTGLPNANAGPTPDDELFLAGDVRANEQVGLTAMHTLFVREHNRLADEIAAADPDLSDEAIYQHARKIVGAQMQVITYHEFLPTLLGPYAPGPYEGYDPSFNCAVSNEFSTSTYRFGHSMLSEQLLRLDKTGRPIPEGHLDLAQAFFNPAALTDAGGIDPILRGLGSQVMQQVDTRLVDAVRNFLFGPPGAGGFDLAALNIQRGRDHGLPAYNDALESLGLDRVTDFTDITSDPELQAALASAYATVDDVDLWVGGLAEDHLPGSSLGECFTVMLADQFSRLRRGDRFYYANDAFFLDHPHRLARIENTTLAKIIRRNTDIANLRGNVFVLPEHVEHPRPTPIRRRR